jgi:hypothetical protein
MALFTVEQNNIDNTIKIFDSFYDSNLVVNSNQYDIVKGYFTGIADDKEIAENYTAIFFRIAQEANIDALVLLDTVKGTSKTTIDLDKTLAYYLNSFRSKTCLYGIAVIPRPNQPVARNVVI